MVIVAGIVTEVGEPSTPETWHETPSLLLLNFRLPAIYGQVCANNVEQNRSRVEKEMKPFSKTVLALSFLPPPQQIFTAEGKSFFNLKYVIHLIRFFCCLLLCLSS